MLRRFLPLLALSSSLCSGQSLSIGVKGGVRANDDITGDATSESKRYTVGPMVELGLPLRLSIEVDALYRREGYRTSFGNFAGGFDDRERSNSWEFPMVLKYRLAFPVVSPYVEAGYAPRVISGSVDSNAFSINLGTGERTFSRLHLPTHRDTSHSVVIGTGIQFGLGVHPPGSEPIGN